MKVQLSIPNDIGYPAELNIEMKDLSGRRIMRLKSFTAAMFSVVIGLSVSVQPVPTATNFLGSIPFKLSEAKAQYGQARRVSRRTARRTTRRVARRTSIAGCSPYRAYYNCGGVYYQPVMESGTTVYIVVNP